MKDHESSTNQLVWDSNIYHFIHFQAYIHACLSCGATKAICAKLGDRGEAKRSQKKTHKTMLDRRTGVPSRPTACARVGARDPKLVYSRTGDQVPQACVRPRIFNIIYFKLGLLCFNCLVS